MRPPAWSCTFAAVTSITTSNLRESATPAEVAGSPTVGVAAGIPQRGGNAVGGAVGLLALEVAEDRLPGRRVVRQLIGQLGTRFKNDPF